MSFSVTYYFSSKNVESVYRDEEFFGEAISKIENIIVEDLRKGISIEDQKYKWTSIVEDINEDWDTIQVNSNGMKNFLVGIIILKKLKVEFECGTAYGYLDTETFKQIKKQFNIKSVRPCSVCQVNTTKKCSCCKKVYYCSEACQLSNWKDHRKNCV